MTIDLDNFTPFSALLGGGIIGIAVILFLCNCRLAGVSGIANNALTKNDNRFSNILFLIGLILGPIIYGVITSKEIPFMITDNIFLIILGGLFVGWYANWYGLY